ncbi:hypothetical protein PRUPE_1G337200 [Prunus persica]|uniref:Uncharacterized protein n=1 Tax=Prunus persica TaxID=3760 RepID=A0A251R782_PRUPE|nr:hypothetical protein PRUPE_1G337200 [Prunus persica]
MHITKGVLIFHEMNETEQDNSVKICAYRPAFFEQPSSPKSSNNEPFSSLAYTNKGKRLNSSFFKIKRGDTKKKLN